MGYNQGLYKSATSFPSPCYLLFGAVTYLTIVPCVATCCSMSYMQHVVYAACRICSMSYMQKPQNSGEASCCSSFVKLRVLVL